MVEVMELKDGVRWKQYFGEKFKNVWTGRMYIQRENFEKFEHITYPMVRIISTNPNPNPIVRTVHYKHYSRCRLAICLRAVK